MRSIHVVLTALIFQLTAGCVCKYPAVTSIEIAPADLPPRVIQSYAHRTGRGASDIALVRQTRFMGKITSYTVVYERSEGTRWQICYTPDCSLVPQSRLLPGEGIPTTRVDETPVEAADPG